MKNLSVILLLCSLVFSCNKDSDDAYPMPINTYFYPHVLPTKIRNMEKNTVVMVNSPEEYEKYLTDKMSGSAFIDFSLYTLLLAIGDVDCDIMGIKSELTRLSKREYALDVRVQLKRNEMDRIWYATVLVPKAPSDAVIDLNLEIKPAPDLDTVMACGVLRPHENIPWIAEMIERGEAEHHTNMMYSGTIWLTKNKGQDVFVTDMLLYNMASLLRVFDCNGNRMSVTDEDEVSKAFIEQYYANLNYIAIYSNQVYF